MTETEALEELVSQSEKIREKGLEELAKLLTKKNCGSLIEHYLGRLYGWDVRIYMCLVNISMSVEDCSYTINVRANADDSFMTHFRPLIEKVYPYLFYNEEDDEDVYIWYHRWRIERVSKESWEYRTHYKQLVEQSAGGVIQYSGPQEHVIENEHQFLAYTLRHDIWPQVPMPQHPRELVLQLVHSQAFEIWRTAVPERIERLKKYDKFYVIATFLYSLQGHRLHGALKVLITRIRETFAAWKNEYRCALWCNLHGRLLRLALALAPLRLPPYVLLWMLDWLPPMSFRYYRDGADSSTNDVLNDLSKSSKSCEYDPNHLRKLRLYEDVARSYASMTRGCSD